MVFGNLFPWLNFTPATASNLIEKSPLDNLLEQGDVNVLLMVSKDDMKMRKFLRDFLKRTTDVMTFTNHLLRNEYIPIKNCQELEDEVLDNKFLNRKSMHEIADLPSCIWVFDVQSCVSSPVYEDILKYGKQYGISTLTIVKTPTISNLKNMDAIILDKQTLKNDTLRRSLYNSLHNMKQEQFMTYKEFQDSIQNNTTNNKSKILIDIKQRSLYKI